MADNLSSPNATKALATYEAEAAAETRAKLIDEHNSAFRWMIASLFALNGGAILTMFGSADGRVIAVFPAFWVFFGGIVATFLSVFLGQLSDRTMIARMHSWGLYWTTVGVTTERDETYEGELKAAIGAAERLGRSGRLLAIFAMLFFIFGVLTSVVLQQKAEIAKLEARFERLEAEAERQ